MPKTDPLNLREYRPPIVELLRAGRSPATLAEDFEASERTIRNWVRQPDVDEGTRTSRLTTTARKEFTRLRRENRSCGKRGRS